MGGRARGGGAAERGAGGGHGAGGRRRRSQGKGERGKRARVGKVGGPRRRHEDAKLHFGESGGDNRSLRRTGGRESGFPFRPGGRRNSPCSIERDSQGGSDGRRGGGRRLRRRGKARKE